MEDNYTNAQKDKFVVDNSCDIPVTGGIHDCDYPRSDEERSITGSNLQETKHGEGNYGDTGR